MFFCHYNFSAMSISRHMRVDRMTRIYKITKSNNLNLFNNSEL